MNLAYICEAQKQRKRALAGLRYAIFDIESILFHWQLLELAIQGICNTQQKLYFLVGVQKV